MRVVLDTNVIVSALLNPNGIPGRIVALALNGKVKLLYDTRIMFEYSDVLSREDFGFNEETINDLIDYFRSNGEFVNSEYTNSEFIDDADRKFYEVFKSGEAEYLITGNIKHFPRESGIALPREFIEKYNRVV
jgi:putative PIN family toxin of toxin-antitoxin system